MPSTSALLTQLLRWTVHLQLQDRACLNRTTRPATTTSHNVHWAWVRLLPSLVCRPPSCEVVRVRSTRCQPPPVDPSKLFPRALWRSSSNHWPYATASRPMALVLARESWIFPPSVEPIRAHKPLLPTCRTAGSPPPLAALGCLVAMDPPGNRPLESP